MSVLKALPWRWFPPESVDEHPDGHACFACAEWRAEMRRRGWQPTPARDWRGVEFAP